MTEKEAIEFCKNNPEAAAKIILMVERLEERIKTRVPETRVPGSNS